MRVLLIRPPRIKQAVTIGEFMFCEPLGLEIVYAVLKDRHEVRLVDMMIDACDVGAECAAWKPDVVGLTSLCVDVPNVLELARAVKRVNPGIVTIVGGSQAYLDAESFEDQAVDHVMEYTTRANLRLLFDGIGSGRAFGPIDGVRSRTLEFRSTDVPGHNEYIVPDLSCTAGYRSHYSYFGFKPCAIMQTSQGCGKQCRFCLRWRIEGPVERPQSLDTVMDYIAKIPERNIMILDNDFLNDGPRLDAFCERLERGRVDRRFLCYGSVFSVLRNREQVRRFGRNGLKAALVGYETFDDGELSAYRKKSTTSDNLEAARFLKEIGVDVWASFIMHPDWGVQEFRKLRACIRKLRPEITTLTALTPFVKSALYDEYKDRLLFPREDYAKWTFGSVVIRPSRMSLRRYYMEVLKTFLYINFVSNNAWYLARKFGVGTLLRISAGAFRLFRRFTILMAEAPAVERRASG